MHDTSIDMSMSGVNQGTDIAASLVQLVNSGQVSMGRLDASVRRILHLKEAVSARVTSISSICSLMHT
jgi:beta-glucosidase-like glycosyl hydrolase